MAEYNLSKTLMGGQWTPEVVRHNIQNPEFGQHSRSWDFHWSQYVDDAIVAVWDQMDEYAKIAVYIMAVNAAPGS